jgi:hypothetical protein
MPCVNHERLNGMVQSNIFGTFGDLTTKNCDCGST